MTTTIANGRIEAAFERLKIEGRKALITFITAGDPDLSSTKDIILALEEAGADIIELGVPFSDPMADGPTIQASSERAVKKGTHLKDVLRLVKDVRKETEVPIVLFGYYNPVFNYGIERFARDARSAGADGALIVDLPAEEAGELKERLDEESLDMIFLLTPTSNLQRMELVASKASGFIYFVSVTGVTGARSSVSGDAKGYVAKIRKVTDLPVGVGFGISTPAQAKEVAKYADAVIVGSAIVNVIAKNPANRKKLVGEVKKFVSGLRAAMDS